ncbi:hypothetical protein [Moorena sp. SIO2C4]|nr:hypothetical protein [Moorena sp. SIO2C4]
MRLTHYSATRKSEVRSQKSNYSATRKSEVRSQKSKVSDYLRFGV